MKKKVLSALLTTAMLASMLVGCGSSNEAPAASTDAAPAASTEAKTEAPASTEAAEPAAAEEGKVFNIYCWNEEFKSDLQNLKARRETECSSCNHRGRGSRQWAAL